MRKKYENVHVLKGSCRHLKSNLAMQVFPAGTQLSIRLIYIALSSNEVLGEPVHMHTKSSEPSMLAYTKIAVSTMQRVELENYYE